MATLQRRVQILFDPAQYDALEAEAARQGRSVAAVIREAVTERLVRPRQSRQEAFERLLARSSVESVPPPVNWAAEKDEFDPVAPLDRP